MASAVVGIDTRQTMAYQAFTFLLSLVIISIIFGVFFRARFTASRILPRFGTVGEPLSYRVVIKNITGKTQRGLFLLENFEDPRPSFEEFIEGNEPGEKNRNLLDRAMGYHKWLWLISRKQVKIIKKQPLSVLLPNAEEEVQIEIVPSQRGHLKLTGLTVVRADPFGLFNSLISIPLQQSVLVLPKRYSLPPVHLPGSRRYHSGGVALASSVGDSEEFISMRDYRPGDPLRRIHWRSWAKTGKPIVKEYQDEFFVRHALVVDTFSKRGHSEVFEEAISVAASFACTIGTLESLLDLMFVGPRAYCFTFGRGLSHTDKTLEILASVRPCLDKSFNILPPMVLERASMLSSCICIFISWDEKRKSFVDQLKAIGVPILVLIISETETSYGLDTELMKDISEHFYILEPGRIQKGLAGI
ncbi:MAG: DUF58 domain-containing protein [Pseudomonadota bacterium]